MWEGKKPTKDWCKCVQVDAIKYDRSKVVMAKRIYPVHSHVKYGYRYAPLVSRQHGKAPRVAWTAFHNVQLAPPGLPHVRSSRGFAVERSQSEGAQAPGAPCLSPTFFASRTLGNDGYCLPCMHLGCTAAVFATSLTHTDQHKAVRDIDA